MRMMMIPRFPGKQLHYYCHWAMALARGWPCWHFLHHLLRRIGPPPTPAEWTPPADRCCCCCCSPSSPAPRCCWHWWLVFCPPPSSSLPFSRTALQGYLISRALSIFKHRVQGRGCRLLGKKGVGGGSAPAAAPVFKKGVVVVLVVFSQLSCVRECV